MHPSLTNLSHRPWPLPEGAWTWRQSWNDLLFVHYRAAKEVLQPLVPRDIIVQEFDGSSWIGIVPFRMNNVMMGNLPAVPGISNFLELNVRLYVEYQGKPGVWFLTLDATNPLVVWIGNWNFHLPYKHAAIKTELQGDLVHYTSSRRNSPADFEVMYKPYGETYFATPGSIEHFLTERYCFYTHSKDGLLRADVHHAPWPLRNSTAEVRRNTLLESWQLEVKGPAFFHASTGVDVISWNPVRT